jgi:hypothetical protein
MEVEFRRTGDRRYGVTIIRSGHRTLEMNPAPGYDARLPHDLIHLVVERELGLRHGIFGQLAAGGTAGTFHSIGSDRASARDAARARRALAKRGATLQRQGQEDSIMSEQAADIGRRAWLARAEGGVKLPADLGPFSAEQVARICDQLDELSTAWSRLQIGQALTVHWPEGSTTSRRGAGMRPNH